MTPNEGVRLRKESKIFLVGHVSNSISGSKLPSKRQVLSMYFFNVRNRGIDRKSSALIVADAVNIFWRQAAIPTHRRDHIQTKTLSLVQNLRKLQKHAVRGGEVQKRKEATFVDELDDLFDIARDDALETIANPEDAEFLKMQRRKGRPGCMASIDKVLLNKLKRRTKREEQEEIRRKRTNNDNHQAAVSGKYK